LTIRTADCMPVLLVDPVRRVVAAAHAGWRGMAAGIVLNTVIEMQRRYASRPQDLEALLGPSIRVESYEVGEEVAARFAPAAVAATF
jgi:polyphenol oxidase